MTWRHVQVTRVVPNDLHGLDFGARSVEGQMGTPVDLKDGEVVDKVVAVWQQVSDATCVDVVPVGGLTCPGAAVLRYLK